MTLRRGFLAEAERTATDLIVRSGQQGKAPIDVHLIARAANVRVVAADQLIDAQRLRDLERVQAYAFSACTFDVGGKRVVVFNPLHSKERSNSDIAHELGHIVLDHELSEVREIGGLPFRSCQPDLEAEATTLGAAILVPEKGLLAAARGGADVTAIAQQFEVSKEMAQFRWNKVGVTKRLNRQTAYAKGRP